MKVTLQPGEVEIETRTLLCRFAIEPHGPNWTA